MKVTTESLCQTCSAKLEINDQKIFEWMLRDEPWRIGFCSEGCRDGSRIYDQLVTNLEHGMPGLEGAREVNKAFE